MTNSRHDLDDSETRSDRANLAAQPARTSLTTTTPKVLPTDKLFDSGTRGPFSRFLQSRAKPDDRSHHSSGHNSTRCSLARLTGSIPAQSPRGKEDHRKERGSSACFEPPESHQTSRLRLTRSDISENQRKTLTYENAPPPAKVRYQHTPSSRVPIPSKQREIPAEVLAR